LRDAQILRGAVRGGAGPAKGPRFAGRSFVIDDVLNTEALPVLERLARFAGARHRLITNNIANFDTPGYRPADLSVGAFQKQLGEAVDQRRAGRQPAGIELEPEPKAENILFHDGNDRDLERTMQDLVENFLTFRLANELMHSRLNLINTAIRERI
jgi:flagellar basal-body rod protein FlgB